MNDFFSSFTREAEKKINAAKGVPENKQVIKRVFAKQSKRAVLLFLSDDSHSQFQRMSGHRKHDPVNDLKSSQSRQCQESKKKRENYAIFISKKRKKYEQKLKAIICVLVGEQQFCKIFLLRECDSEISAVFFLPSFYSKEKNC